MNAEDIEAALAKIPRRKPEDVPVTRLTSADSPLSLADAGPLSPEAFGSLPLIPADQIEAERARRERHDRAVWDARFEAARVSIPERFRWVTPVRVPKNDEPDSMFAPTPEMSSFMPWFAAFHARRLRSHWLSGRNILLSGPVGSGKTSLLVLLARWTLACAGYDAPAVRKRRDELDTHTRAPRSAGQRYAPLDPEHLREVGAAARLRFVSAERLLTTDRRGPDEAACLAAERASVLFLDEVGKEIGKDNPGAYLTSLRAPAVQGVLQERWNKGRRWFATTMFGPDELAERYDLGTFRRLVEEESGAAFVDLSHESWAGGFLKEKATRARRSGR